jgi:hypothetical protein
MRKKKSYRKNTIRRGVPPTTNPTRMLKRTFQRRLNHLTKNSLLEEHQVQTAFKKSVGNVVETDLFKE